jgi:hypothetical protein
MNLSTPETIYVVVEIWRGIFSEAKVFYSLDNAERHAERLRNVANVTTDEIAVIETRIE